MTDLHPPPPHFSQNARVSANIWDWPCLLSLTGNSGVKGKGGITFLFIWSTHGKRFLLTSSWACQSYFSTINEVCFQSLRVPGHLVTADQFWYAVSKAHLRVNEQARNVSLEIQEIVDEIMSLGMLRGFFWWSGCFINLFGYCSNPKWVDRWTFNQILPAVRLQGSLWCKANISFSVVVSWCLNL